MSKQLTMIVTAAIVLAATGAWMGLSNGNGVKSLSDIENTTSESDTPVDKYGARLRSMLDTTQEREDKEFYPKSLIILTTSSSDYSSVAESINETVDLRYAFPDQDLISTEPANRSEIKEIGKMTGVKQINLEKLASSDT